MNLATGTVLTQLPTGTIDSLLDVLPLSIGVTGSTPQTIQASLLQVSQFQKTNSFNGVYQASGTVTTLSSSSPIIHTTTGTWTKPAGLAYIVVEMVGGGGGGGGVAGMTTGSACGNGGGGGEYAKKNFSVSSLSGTVSVLVGLGGAGGTAGNNNGVSGTHSSFAGLTANGGQGGNGQAAVGGANLPIPGSSGGGSGGTGGTGGGIHIAGNPSVWGLCASGLVAPSAGGGNALSGNTKSGTAATSDEDGVAGVGYGSGGSGARSSTDNTNRAGGSGANGVVIIWEYILL